MPGLFLLAYALSGLAGLVYEVSWTRLLTLYIGHTTAAASAVVGAFLGGLAVGAGGGGAIASRLSPRKSLQAYVGAELVVVAAAVALPYELSALTPLLKWAYNDAAPGLLFPAVRLLSCLVMVFIPAAALGATFPLAIRWFAHGSDNPARSSSVLYVVNTVGAAIGALLAGFVLIPALGVSGTIRTGMAASALAAVCVVLLVRSDRRGEKPPAAVDAVLDAPARAKRSKGRAQPSQAPAVPDRRWLAVVVLAISGFASLTHEIVWTRILSLVLGPTTYAFAAALAAVISGVAIGSGAGAWMVGRTRRPAAWLALAIAGAALTATWTSSIAGTRIPLLVAQRVAASPDLFDQLLRQGVLLTAALMLPTAACLGAAFPLALSVVSDPTKPAAQRFGLVYAVNTICAVSGSLAAGFALIPLLGLHTTLRVVSGLLIVATLIVVGWGSLTRAARVAGMLATAACAALVVLSPPWDRDLLASGAYMYAPYVPQDLDLETQLKAGTLLYYREGAATTVSVKRLTGTTTLAVDGKTDASNRGDMLTQALVAHLPLLLHEDPHEVAIIGLGSGVTVGAALRHPIARADVIEISPEVVEASTFFEAENHHALADPRTRLIVGDGRSHLLLSDRRYDVIISEPSNPWIAGVAALFTREFFEAARARLAPGGIMCQWANAYNISDPDLRAIVATFKSVFPDGTVWMVGESDVLLVASLDSARDRSLDSARDRSLDSARDKPLDHARDRSSQSVEARLANIDRNWSRPGVAEDLKALAVSDPFSLWTLYMGGPAETARYAAGAPIFTDDRMTLEFSAPRELHRRGGAENAAALSALLGEQGGPPVIREARATAGAAQWRNRGAMMARADVYQRAYDDYVKALTLDSDDPAALEGLVRIAVITRRGPDALVQVRSLAANRPPTPEVLIATSKLLVSVDAAPEAIEIARQAARMLPVRPAAIEQLASLFADAGDSVQLDLTLADLQRIAPDRPATHYYAAVSALIHGQPDEAAQRARSAIAIDPDYAPVYDLIGAAYTKLGRAAEARAAFETSLTFDAHDSTAYTNLGLLELAAGNRRAAASYFAEALWLTPESQTAREGLARAR